MKQRREPSPRPLGQSPGAVAANQQGRVYQKNLGPAAARLARGLKAYDPDGTWTLSPD